MDWYELVLFLIPSRNLFIYHYIMKKQLRELCFALVQFLVLQKLFAFKRE